jgi:hypothetical protein
MATTTAFGWETPDDTDLVKDGAAAIRTLGSSIDTSMAELKGGTTGQVLSKASNTDMDFTWVAQDDANAIQNTQLTAKGALITAFSSATPATLTVGTNGQVLTADSTVATGLAWATPAASGYVGVGVTKSADQSIPNATYTAVTWDGEDWDTNTYHDNSTNNSRVTIPSGKAGKYLVTVNLNYASNGTGGIRLLNIYKNGVATGDNNFQTSSVFNTAAVRSVVMDLAVNDYIQAYAYQDCGGALNLKASSQGTSMQVTYLGA